MTLFSQEFWEDAPVFNKSGSKNMRTIYRLFLGALLSAGCGQALASLAENWRFAVTIDDRPVGFHEFQVVSDADAQRVTSRAEFNVKVLFVNVFRYQHSNTEQWRADCLDTIESSTRMNKESYAVKGFRDADRFRVTHNEQSELHTGCVRTFAYWNPQFLNATRLLNSQTGKLEDVRIESLGSESVSINGRAVDANRYRIGLDKGHVDVWYDVSSNLWLGLESVTADGRTIRYTPVSLPAV